MTFDDALKIEEELRDEYLKPEDLQDKVKIKRLENMLDEYIDATLED